MSIQIAASDVIKLILQFLKENGLTESFQVLQNETGVTYNAPKVPTSQLVSALLEGNWKELLLYLSGLELSPSFLMDLFEHITLELALDGDYHSAKLMIEKSFPLENLLRNNEPDRYVRLERTILLLESGAREVDSFPLNTLERRQQLSRRLLEEQVPPIPSGQLLGLIGQAMKYQYTQGLISPGIEFDLFRGQPHTSCMKRRDERELCQFDCIQRIQTDSGTNIPCGMFSKDGQSFVTGSLDGFIEVWDFLSGKLRLDLSYQVTEEFMMHETSICCLEFSENSQLLASGSIDGQVIVWNFQQGKIIRRFVLPCQPCCLCFKENELWVGCSDGVIRLLGLKSGRILKEYVGHTSFVNHILYWDNNDNKEELMMSASSDGTIRMWKREDGDNKVIMNGSRGGWNPSWSIQMVVPCQQDSYGLIVPCASNRIAIWNRKEEKVCTISPVSSILLP
ncbi:transducin family protein / WD-40 repeat family protein [Galdieria sulphuraria]|uniref:WD40 repeat-containing protein SMU1 n=1 Tax=Galdieria sulphuraria TaxID=130081 RepID=M2WWP3_GALSU|nr:transducin family protein / WD-40 repeat family protein [Galdieria sulphuraria]EME28420.1 transducin family protein / WD-40 repeat family protein [Galdieria sulphuraria]|eukprot:XP_005704940.1 transducin family protein / WD-40 repeat family protein [Galdieria sulphuraria]